MNAAIQVLSLAAEAARQNAVSAREDAAKAAHEAVHKEHCEALARIKGDRAVAVRRGLDRPAVLVAQLADGRPHARAREAAALEGVLVTVSDVTVTSLDTAFNEFQKLRAKEEFIPLRLEF
jgi:hypothetical protein